MAIPSRQIGWSTQSNLLWQISKRLELLIKVMGANNTTTTTTTTSISSNALKLTFDNITNVPVADASSITDWNTFFDLPTLGGAFTSVIVIGNEVNLFGGSNIKVKPGLFMENTSLINVIDSGCITSVGGDGFSYSNITTAILPECTIVYGFEDSPFESSGGFGQCFFLTNLSIPKLIIAGSYSFENIPIINIYFQFLTTVGEHWLSSTTVTNVNLPQATIISNYGFSTCTSLQTINLPSCTNLGDTIGNNNVFLNIIGQTITLTLPAALMTCNSGLPDGDIQYLQANNTLTIITV